MLLWFWVIATIKTGYRLSGILFLLSHSNATNHFICYNYYIAMCQLLKGLGAIMLKIGDVVLWQYYNTPEHTFYDHTRTGKIVDILYHVPGAGWYSTLTREQVQPAEVGIIDTSLEKQFVVQWHNFCIVHISTLQRKEIKRKLQPNEYKGYV
jgi:hypothetical protein